LGCGLGCRLYRRGRHEAALREHRKTHEFLAARTIYEILAEKAESVLAHLRSDEGEKSAGTLESPRIVEDTVLAITFSQIGPSRTDEGYEGLTANLDLKVPERSRSARRAQIDERNQR
jgi:hypothetical protein